LTAELKADLAELSGLSKQVVPGADEEDEAVIAEVDRIHLDAIAAINDLRVVTLKWLVIHRLFSNPWCLIAIKTSKLMVLH
jgi:hypothetical protein